jgi:hypothetical protein
VSVNAIQIYKTKWLKLNSFRILTIVIFGLRCLCSIAKHDSSTIEQLDSVTSTLVNSAIFAMYSFASQCFPNEMAFGFDAWRRT